MRITRERGRERITREREREMGVMGAMLEHPEELYALMKLKIAASKLSKQIPAEPHWGFSYSMLQKVSRSFALVIQQLGPELRNAVTLLSSIRPIRWFLYEILRICLKFG